MDGTKFEKILRGTITWSDRTNKSNKLKRTIWHRVLGIEVDFCNLNGLCCCVDWEWNTFKNISSSNIKNISSSNAILLLLSSWFTTVAGPSLACGHPPITLLQKNGKRRRRWRQEGGGRRTTSRRRRRGGGGENNRNLVVLVLLREYQDFGGKKKNKKKRGEKIELWRHKKKREG